ncbi:WD40-repeat-containing domain protein [Gigaspora rosea]|uniref:WD40-repeat-containing domain protein n=1 Tax=Gigaspora rosea TaxID=44941 RepID=A0A397VIM5_9GLOM|nr:WD40-repeat-containing domain protein [Gigaspora rosea]
MACHRRLKLPLTDITRQSTNSFCRDDSEPLLQNSETPPRKRIKLEDNQPYQSRFNENKENDLISTALCWNKELYASLTSQHTLFRRELWGTAVGGSPMASTRWNASTRFFMKNFASSDKDIFKFLGDRGLVAPFACSFSHVAQDGKCLAVADEEGMVGLIDARYDNTIETERVRTEFRAHDNAVFDIMWSPDDRQMVTASGDQTARLWDVELQQCKAVFLAHTCSIKSVNYNSIDPNMWVTASRDGNIFIWDARTVGMQTPEGETLYKPVNSIRSAHSLDNPKKKTRKSCSLPHRSKPTSSVTGAQFLKHQQHLLASSGAIDGIIKFWDLRNHSNTKASLPVQISINGATAKRPHGISTLILDNSGTRLYANSTDNYIYQYDPINLGAPLTRFTSPTFRCSSFYIRMAISPDDRYIVSGSSDKCIYMWETDFPDENPIVLKAHENEVTSLSWSRDLELFASCSDDTSLRLWRVDKSNSNE